MPDIKTCRAINSGSQDKKKKKTNNNNKKAMKNKQHDSNILREAHRSIQLTS